MQIILTVLAQIWHYIVISIVTLVGAAIDFYSTYHLEIDKVVLRIEKDAASAGGWTNEKKEQEAVDLYLEYKPKLPTKIKIILLFVPDAWELNFVKGIIRKLCAKAAALKPVP